MIRVMKPGAGPAILSNPRSRGPKETERLCDAYDAGIRDFEFESSIYGARSVKNALTKAQHGKCAFCESKFPHIGFGNVEHFRPKGGWVQTEGDLLTKPGYYWLAYAWGNLYASCQICNQKFKRNLFPLADAATRLSSHHDDPSREEPLLVDPGGSDDPGAFIGFREEYPFAIGGNPKGTATIEMLGLDREELAEARRDAFKPFILILLSVRALEQERLERLSAEELGLLTELREWLAAQRLPSAQYSAMFNAVSSPPENSKWERKREDIGE